MQVNGPLGKNLASALGALTGVVGLIAMIRLIAGAGFTSVLVWVFVLAAMLPWLGYCVWRARHGRLSVRAALIVLGLDVVGLICVWLFTLGPVLALASTLLAFVIIWVHDWPQVREKRESRYVRVEELTQPDPDAETGLDDLMDPGLTTEAPRTAA